MIPTLLDCYGDNLKALQDATKKIVEAEGWSYEDESLGYYSAYSKSGAIRVRLPHGVLPMEIALKMAEERGVKWFPHRKQQDADGYIQDYFSGWFDGGKCKVLWDNLLVSTANPHDHLALLTALVKSYEVKK